MSDSEVVLRSIVDVLDRSGKPEVEIALEIVLVGGVRLVGNPIGLGRYQALVRDNINKDVGRRQQCEAVLNAIATATDQSDYMSLRETNGTLWRIRLSTVIAWGFATSDSASPQAP